MLAKIVKLIRRAPSGAIDALVRQVVEMSLEDVVERVSARVDAMTLSEARGYVRARAAQVVRYQTHLAIAKHSGAEQHWTARIVSTATERIVTLVLRQTGVGLPRRTEMRMAA